MSESKPTFEECIAQAYAVYVEWWFDNQEAEESPVVLTHANESQREAR